MSVNLFNFPHAMPVDLGNFPHTMPTSLCNFPHTMANLNNFLHVMSVNLFNFPHAMPVDLGNFIQCQSTLELPSYNASQPVQLPSCRAGQPRQLPSRNAGQPQQLPSSGFKQYSKNTKHETRQTKPKGPKYVSALHAKFAGSPVRVGQSHWKFILPLMITSRCLCVSEFAPTAPVFPVLYSVALRYHKLPEQTRY